MKIVNNENKNNLERICILLWLPLAKDFLSTSTLALGRVGNDDE